MLKIKNIMRKFVLTILCISYINAYALAVVPVPISESIHVQEKILPTALKGRVVTVPVGSSFTAKMQSAVSSASLKSGDNIAAVLTSDWMFQNMLIAPIGSILYGKVIKVEQAGKAYKNGKFEFQFNEVITPDGQSIKLASNTYALTVDSKRPLKIASTIGKTTILGALAGAAHQNRSDNDDDSNSSGNSSVLIGAGLGLLVGVVTTMSQRGEDVELPRNTLINVKLSEPIVVNVSM